MSPEVKTGGYQVGRVDGGMEQSANYLRRGQVSEPLRVDQPEEAGPGVAGHQPVGGRAQG